MKAVKLEYLTILTCSQLEENLEWLTTSWSMLLLLGDWRGLDDGTEQDDMEILTKNSHWRKVSIKLPQPRWGFTTTITSDDHLLIVFYAGAGLTRYKKTNKITSQHNYIDQQHNSDHDGLTKWTELTAADHWFTDLVPSLFHLW